MFTTDIPGKISAKTYSAVLFDIDGTLMDTRWADLLSLQEAIFQTTGVQHPLDGFQKFLGSPGIVAMRELGVPDPESCSELHKELFPRYQIVGNSCMFPQMLATLEALRDRHIPMGIVTARNHHEFYTDPLMTPELCSFFDAIVVAETTERRKPYGDPLWKGMELLGVRAEDSLYVGDTPRDYGCATACGVDFILATWGSHHQIPESTYHPTSPSDILAIVDGTFR